MNQIIIESTYIPRPHALKFHARGERFAVMVMHRRAGKTVMCIGDLIDKAMQCHLPFPQYSYVCPFYSQAKSVAWNYLKMYTDGIAEKIMESELSVVLRNGAKIRLFGADNPDALRGLYHDGVILDEYGDMAPRLFGEVIAPALADRKGWCVFIGTPKGPNHFKTLWDDAATDSRWFKTMLKASQSGVIDEVELEMLKHLPGSDENTFAQEFECDFNAAVRGAYYGTQLNELEARGNMGLFPYDSSRAVHLSFDIGYSDDTSIWFYQTDGKVIRAIDFFTANGYSVDDILGMLRDRPYAYGTFHLPHDAANKSFQTGKSVRELFIAAGCTVRMVPSLSVQDGIQAVRKTLPNVYFNISSPDVKVGLDALRVYQRKWDDKKKIFSESPLHDWSSNPADSFRYMCLAVNPASARREGAVLKTHTPAREMVNNVLSLESLYAERKRASGDSKRI
jgi:hypothetical protein